jgi:hypothetical protein
MPKNFCYALAKAIYPTASGSQNALQLFGPEMFDGIFFAYYYYYYYYYYCKVLTTFISQTSQLN